MLFFIRQDGKEHRIRVESRYNQLFVTFDDEREKALDIHYYGNDVSFIQDNQVFRANVVGEKDAYTVWRPQGNIELSLESEYRRIVNMLRGQDLGDANNVYAKMPGKIVKVLAKVGEQVEKGASVMIMEAMKMENEIRATLSGQVTNICVKEGQAVETGMLLMELKGEE